MRAAVSRAALHVPPQVLPGANASHWIVGEHALGPIAERYRGSFPVSPISHGTVRDYADSVDRMPGLAGATADMKDLQRCWTLKAILGNVEAGSRILEIGAGEPLVAGILSRLGYEVTVVDPYEGSGNGPRQFKRFRMAYPDLRFLREEFPPSEPLEDGFAAIYSISVLEHVPLDQIDQVIGATRALLDKGQGHSVHTVDHVLAGWSAAEHREKLDRIVAASGLPASDLEQTIEAMESDPDTYFVSAEAHNRWRAGAPYDEYAMRRIGSINLFSSA
jgi:SAM-dependent methyltransferase